MTAVLVKHTPIVLLFFTVFVSEWIIYLKLILFNFCSFFLTKATFPDFKMNECL